MTLKSVTDTLVQCAEEEINVNYVGVGDVYDLNSKPDVDYSVVWLTEGQHQITQDSIVYSFTVFYIDRITDYEDNVLKTHSDGLQVIQNILNRFMVKTEYDCELEYPLRFIPFNQRFADDCTGVFTTVNIYVDNDNSTCVY